MRATRRVLAVALALLGTALVVVGVRGGVWPLSIQFLAGLALIAFAYLRWRSV
jgi:hypothetical protein